MRIVLGATCNAPEPARSVVEPACDALGALRNALSTARERVPATHLTTSVEVATRRAAILSLIASLELVELDAVILNRASQSMPTELGLLDAIHLATALLWKEMAATPIAMATHDRALELSAKAHGLAVIGSVRLRNSARAWIEPEGRGASRRRPSAWARPLA